MTQQARYSCTNTCHIRVASKILFLRTHMSADPDPDPDPEQSLWEAYHLLLAVGALDMQARGNCEAPSVSHTVEASPVP